MRDRDLVWIVTVNWRNPEDTIQCIASVLLDQWLGLAGIVIVDNGSGDGSVERILRWIGDHGFTLTRTAQVSENSRSSTEQHQTAVCWRGCGDHGSFEIVLLDAGANLGFAGGNNAGIEWLRRSVPFSAVFLLNNDAVVEVGAVAAMNRRLGAVRVGMCGARVLYWHPPGRVQALGGASYWPVLGRAKHLGAGLPADAVISVADIEKRLDYVLGAALMITRECLEDIGPMEERYFLYYEEIDWAVRARRRGWSLAYADDAIVRHKEGGSIGSSSRAASRSLLSDYYLLRSRLSFTRKAYPYWLPTVLMYSVLLLARNLLRGDLERVRVQWAALVGGAFVGKGVKS